MMNELVDLGNYSDLKLDQTLYEFRSPLALTSFYVAAPTWKRRVCLFVCLIQCVPGSVWGVDVGCRSYEYILCVHTCVCALNVC